MTVAPTALEQPLQEPGPLLPRVGPRVWLGVSLYLSACWTLVLASAWRLAPAAGLLASGLALYTTVPVIVFLARGLGFRTRPGVAFRLWLLRPLWYVHLTLPIATLAWLVGLVAGAPFGAGLATAQAFLPGAVVLLLALFAVGYAGSRRLVVREVTVTAPGLPEAFNGFRIAQISDLHVGPHLPRKTHDRIVAAVERRAPDLIAITGDLVDDHAGDTEDFIAAFGALSAPSGVFAVPGNHDVYAGWAGVERRLRATSIQLLVNRTHVLHRGDAVLAAVGTGDPAAGRPPGSGAPDVTRALAEVPDGAAVVALAHNPSLWPALAERGVALTLSGHTHWGQLALPRLGWCLASPFVRYAMGAHTTGRSTLYINPGTGYWGLPFRLGAYAEVTIVTLRRGDAVAIVVGAPRRER
jgi:predicted MPP superfamily phosphohydrolase